ncbi:MAG TPA: LPXTG cell wall anchor domain-containing protein [Magnetospirillaceae bacterium]|nr:LPXTG cell wall anchor domain-containing protein [Magnetospirillaceae bacterium]
MRVTKRVAQGLAALAATVATGLLVLGLSTAPAAATGDPNSGTIDTSVTSLATAQPQAETKGDECTGDKCKKIPWCPPNGQPPVGITADAPMVLLGDDKTDTPTCVKKPKVEYKCCVADESGTASIHVVVTNYNPFKMRVKVGLDDGTPIVKWVNGNDKATFVFANVNNGVHEIHASVWAGGDTWCKFVDKRITVKCAPPSPSQSPSPSPSETQTESPGPSASTNPGDQLPQTGSSILPLAGGGALALATGIGMVFFGRRRRDLAAIGSDES